MKKRFLAVLGVAGAWCALLWPRRSLPQKPMSVFRRQDDFDYTTWQRDYFDRKQPGQVMAEAADYARAHPYQGQAKQL